MFSTLRNRFGIPGVISVIALVFALVGGAFAANNLGGSGNGATASAKKSLKGPRGPRGRKGATGAAGPAGAAGAAGRDGTPGLNGEDGATGPKGATGTIGLGGTAGATGPTGPEGPQGEPWTAGGTLPPGETLTGVWATPIVIKEPEEPSAEVMRAELSFPIPLEAGIVGANAHYIKKGEPAPSGCTGGTAAVPVAEPGHICVYVTNETSVSGELQLDGTVRNPTTTLLALGASRFGAVLSLQNINKKTFARAHGTWTVTAPLAS
jgi:hypothetical protein